MGLALGPFGFDQWQWKEELKVLGLEDVSFGECLNIQCIHFLMNTLFWIFILQKVKTTVYTLKYIHTRKRKD